jgi:hypothetical protein
MGSAKYGLDWLALEPTWNGDGALSNRLGLCGFWAQVWRSVLKRPDAWGIREEKDPAGEISKGFVIGWLLEVEHGASWVVVGVNW